MQIYQREENVTLLLNLSRPFSGHVSPSHFWLNGEDAATHSVCKLNAEQDGLYEPLVARKIFSNTGQDVPTSS